MAQHIVTSFDEDLKELNSAIGAMGGYAEELFGNAITALLHSDPDMAQEVISKDRIVDAMQRDIEERAVLLIARRQPVAQDLRETMAAIRISGDLERVADLGKNIARRTIAMESTAFRQTLMVGVEHLAQLGLQQMKQVLDAYALRDTAAAAEVWKNDSEIDAVYTSLFRELLTYMMEDPRNISRCIHLLFCAKNIERIGDHATNIAETVHYMVTGQQIEEERASSTRV
ncbi:phosphate transport system protein [Faunimonas pinastri]|uniref:Phosphate-specific transport system accessory protein PhoU n=1 Tax=Faunimonas pinastri TaxID=1855383 RepID=A0A1H8ZGI5_9HYPH|nr:phosphate signaling complex protein PhoU [Faunimonas pinastri]SEP63464.1 phosphate transport system protein [Faunimonas pinastri]